MSWCGHCGLPTPAHELAPMAHSPKLPACRSCRARVEVTGHHQRPFHSRKEGSAVPSPHEAQHAALLAVPPIPPAGADLVEVV